FDYSSMKRFIHSACTACMRGLLSSIKQHVKELFTLSLLDTPCARRGDFVGFRDYIIIVEDEMASAQHAMDAKPSAVEGLSVGRQLSKQNSLKSFNKIAC
ncbi:MAG TPA: hypothetical protein VFW07_19210, partial [Parafilimonas sp.]|nr:hypothetical protein [Parafilimonas sp.]